MNENLKNEKISKERKARAVRGELKKSIKKIVSEEDLATLAT